MIDVIKFNITEKQYIQVIPEPFQEGDCEVCAMCDVYYIDEDIKLNIRFGYTEIETFNGVVGIKNFDDLLDNKLFFDVQQRIDPGFEYNQYCQELIARSDVMNKYFFESNSHKAILPYYMSWFYNDKDGNIVFEITPFYPWHYATKKKCSDKIPYKEWIKNYQVTIRKIIPKETLIAWDNQAKLYNHWKHD
ncbi:hypothetical protein KBD08_00580 [Candidatus Babeliales bacterium]|nr:hypothetical protein [Candidatus Babeliales bacterium]